jgi:hypothetical protein
LALPLWAACSVLVDPESLQVRCEIEGDGMADPCQPLGQHCINNVCIDCDMDARELCNGRDDDCDGEIDEGHDADKDGFTWCGGGKVEMADCVDSDAKIHPSSNYEDGTAAEAPVEACDGKDNDCDSKVDEDASCASMKKCMDDSGCPEDKRCDVGSGVCFIPREVGSGCTNDSDCKGGFCLQPGSFALPVSLMDNRCATACCSNADCDEGSSCLISSSGARVCLPKNIVGGGSRKAGERCGSDSDCAAGLCLRGLCQTRCMNSQACPKQECVLTPNSPTEPRMFVCADPSQSSRLQPGEYCGLLGSCRTGYCGEDSLCGQACAREADCGSKGFCEFVEIGQGLIGPNSQASVCHWSSIADPEGIEQLCCTDQDCGSNQLCAPHAVDKTSMQWHMNCRAK